MTAVHYLRAGRRAGLYGFDSAPAFTVMVRDTNGKPILRDDYEGFLRTWMEEKETGSRLPVLEGAEVFVVASALWHWPDKLAGQQRLGGLARRTQSAGRRWSWPRCRYTPGRC
ncbi:hypothetical protein [Streptosporangium canum]|uniref:hypothetical protein n=1 Tax=Streptosporangium canum TaxID=324952 RepID=UPI0037AB79B3